MNEPERGPDAALKFARCAGAEWAANPGTPRSEYYASIAWYYGIDEEDRPWLKVPGEERASLVRAFNDGAEAERKAQREMGGL